MNNVQMGDEESRDVQHSTRSVPDRHVTQTTGALSVGAVAFGALAVGATAIGAVAVGRLAIGAFTIRRGRLRSLTVESLEGTASPGWRANDRQGTAALIGNARKLTPARAYQQPELMRRRSDSMS